MIQRVENACEWRYVRALENTNNFMKPFFLGVCSLALFHSAHAQTSSAFPFVLPWNDGAPSLISTNLNVQPAGANGRIVARDGHFIESKTGRRARLVGVVWTFSASFPTHGEAEQVAARLAKYGVNAVRIHYIDMPGPARASIWKKPGVIDEAQLDRLDYLLAQFKKRGIYVNFNLKVSRSFSEAEGFPASVSQLPWASKRADYFNARMIALQKDFARDILTHRNPYTNDTLANDPGVYAIEINNENSLSENDDASEILRFPEPFREQAQVLWNEFLARRYASTARLQAAWKTSAARGPELLQAKWPLERHDPTQVTQTLENAATRVQVRAADGTGWHAQIMQGALSLQDGQVYTFTVRARADSDRRVPVTVSRDQADWRSVGLLETLNLSPQTKTFTFVFTAHETVPNHSRIALEFGGADGDYEIESASLRAGAPSQNLPDNALETRRVAMPEARFGRVLEDWRDFLFQTERAYNQTMRDYLKNDLRVGAMIVNTQASYGRLTGVYREQISDYTDLHAYWGHPELPNGAWHPVSLAINNAPMTPVAGTTGSSTFAGLMRTRVGNKPFSISEYNHPAPNEYSVETLPLLASVAARQDWDAWLLHEYGDYGADADTSKIQAYFAVGSDPNKWAFLPSMSVLFRRALVNPATPIVSASMPAKFPAAQDFSVDSAWKGRDLQNAAFNAKTQLYLGAAPSFKIGSAPASDARLQVADAETERAVFSAQAPGAIVLSGALGNRAVSVGRARFVFGDAPNNFAALTCVAWDDAPLPQSKHLILTVMARARNTNQTWRADRRALTSWGAGPTLVDGVQVQVALPCDGPRRVFALDETGKPKQPLKSTFAAGILRFAVEPSQRAVWYAILK